MRLDQAQHGLHGDGRVGSASTEKHFVEIIERGPARDADGAVLWTDDGQPRTLDEIGQVYGVTRERIRQIESKTMSKLRHPSRSQVLRDYLD